VALYISYGLGTSIIGDTGRPCWVVVSSYVGTALLAWASLGWWVTDRKKAFRKSQEYGESESWRKEILTSARSSFWGVFLVGAATVGVQLSL
jgi:hypothetical protein